MSCCVQGNVTTPVPVTDGSGVLCYTGSPQAGDLESSFCHHGQTIIIIIIIIIIIMIVNNE